MKHDYFEIAGKAFIEYLDRVFKPFSENINAKFPIMIMNTGDEVYLSNMMDNSKADKETLYSLVPRMPLDIKNISILKDQLTSNVTLGQLTVENDQQFKQQFKSNVRRIPINWTINSEVVFNNIFEYLKFVEVYLTMSHHNHYFTFYYAGAEYSATFDFQDDMDSEVNLSLAFDTEKRNRKLPLTFVVSLQYPSFDWYQIGLHDGMRIPANQRMDKIIHNMHVDDPTEQGIVTTTEILKGNE